MDRNAVIGLLVIGAILLGWQFWMQPSNAEMEAMRKKQDSIEAVEAKERVDEKAQQASQSEPKAEQSTQVQDTIQEANNDSVVNVLNQQKYGSLAPFGSGKKEYYTLENERVIIKFSNKGAVPVEAQLKNYTTYDSLPLMLFTENHNTLNLQFDHQNRKINSTELFFDVEQPSDSQLVFSMEDETGAALTMAYTLGANENMLQFSMNRQNIATNDLLVNWNQLAPKSEKAVDNERQYTTIYYKIFGDDVDNLTTMGDEDSESPEEDLKWISFKQQFFSTTLIAEDKFKATNSNLAYNTAKSEEFTKDMSATFTIPAGSNGNFKMYLGPTKYSLLKKYDLDLEDQVELGWALFRWMNQILIIPTFNFLSSFNIHIGLVILILTLFIKTLLFPITYKTYLSSAKQRAIKPEIEEINKKYGEKDQMKKQQETMALYQKTGVNPFAGCIPMLIQLPILIAMFRFFPASIELRQKSFLWADDLSSYDVLFDLPFDIPLYGDHVSGLTILMAISMFLTSKYNMQSASMGGGNAQAKQIQAIMIYFMPVMLLFWFNNYSAGLSLYYFTANMTTLGQQFVIRKFFINEDKIRAKIEENKKKPKKKSKFQQRLQDMQEQQQQGANRKMRRNK
ncbi:MAG: membrane protein insertase YidC [Salibacter sp.]|uniref:membrane protein insertase YidC n=1 Tax=Salibacter sp. TaxID=2010995 RepID=UPI00286FE71E|nr:membrane protein insertase YidC [Salibacter sp.]MDR9397969.1 membrane protein insertase YidC [Salibacter sp.]